jgi:hypothetical protein
MNSQDQFDFILFDYIIYLVYIITLHFTDDEALNWSF